jgi:hypothetical protein
MLTNINYRTGRVRNYAPARFYILYTVHDKVNLFQTLF